MAFQGRIFCGEAFFRSYGGSLRVVQRANEVPSYGVSFLVPAQGRNQLGQIDERATRFQLRARIEPQIACFVARRNPDDEQGCSPFERPVYLHVLSARRD